jgi:hypothetical protein
MLREVTAVQVPASEGLRLMHPERRKRKRAVRKEGATGSQVKACMSETHHDMS